MNRAVDHRALERGSGSSSECRRVPGSRGGLGLVAVLGWVAAAAAGCGGEEGKAPGRTAEGPRTSRAAVETGGAVEYVYDGAGNVVEIRTASPTEVTVTDFEPKSGGFGQRVTIFGSGFSVVPGGNNVILGGVVAPVLSASAATLEVEVPFGATTGRISITSGQRTGVSPVDFTVAAEVIVADFSPKLGKSGTVVNITGQNFNPDRQGNAVSIGGGPAVVNGAAREALEVTAGTAVASGRVTVSTGWGAGESADDFYAVPDGMAVDEVAFTGRAVVGVPATIVLPVAGKKALLIFEGTAGRSMTALVTANSLAGSTQLLVRAPGGATVFSGTAAPQDVKLKLGTLQESGVHTLVITPPVASAGQLTVQLLEYAIAGVELGGASVPLTLGRGQNGRYTFDGQAGDLLSFAVTSLTTLPLNASVFFRFQKPDGSLLYSFTYTAPAAVAKFPYTLPTSGAYTLDVEPAGTASAAVTTLMSLPVLGSLPADGTTARHESTRPAQIGRYTFTGTAGDGWTMHAIGGNGFAGTVTVLKPGGGTLASTTLNTTTTTQRKLELGVLAASGTYTVEVVPSGLSTGSVDMRLVAEARGTVTVDGPTTAVMLNAAQNGRYTFEGQAGDLLSFAVTSLATTPANGFVEFAFNNPNGSLFYTFSYWTPTAVPKLPYTLATSGAYTLHDARDLAPRRQPEGRRPLRFGPDERTSGPRRTWRTDSTSGRQSNASPIGRGGRHGCGV